MKFIENLRKVTVNLDNESKEFKVDASQSFDISSSYIRKERKRNHEYRSNKWYLIAH